MKLLLATMFKKVPVRKTNQRATICKRCGTRIYSLSFLKKHLEAHDRKTLTECRRDGTNSKRIGA